MRYSYVDSPLGRMLVTRDAQGITGLDLPHARRPATVGPDWQRVDAAFDDVRAQLAEYFAGTRRQFELPLHMIGGAFQRRVWEALLAIGYGETVSYGELAAAIGVPGSARAVGAANGQNPIPIIVPCHRVIGADGSLTGYGGGLPAKRFLLDHEAAQRGLFVV